ncbi:MAG: hypothetical protein ACLQGP_30010 [Isosphaeraceae bacterium]
MGAAGRTHDRTQVRRAPDRRAKLVLYLGLSWIVVAGGVALAQSPDGSAPIEAQPALADLVFESDESPSYPTTRSPLSEVIYQSLVGRLRPDLWRPLGLGTLFSEGWDEQYAPAPDPAGEGAPRQTWINNADGAFYRLFVFSFGYAGGLPGNGSAYNGSYFMFTPLSRRFEIGWFLPFVNSSPDLLNPRGNRYWTDVGDLTIAPRVMLAEDRRYAITTNLYTRLPTGSISNGNGVASLSPDLEFWVNPPNRWVIRGAAGVTFPTNETRDRLPILALSPFNGFNSTPSSMTSFDARFAIGHYITPSDARLFPDFVYYVAANFHTALSGGHATYFSLTPG